MGLNRWICLMICRMPVRVLLWTAGTDPIQNRFCDVEIATTDTEVDIRLVCTMEVGAA